MKINFEINPDEPFDQELLHRYVSLPALCRFVWQVMEQDWSRDVRCRLNALLEENGINIYDIYS